MSRPYPTSTSSSTTLRSPPTSTAPCSASSGQPTPTVPGDQTIHRRKTNDLGGIRHVAVEVSDAVATYAFIRSQQQAYGKRGLHIEIVGEDHVPEEITPFPYKFFYWIDPWGVQWEMEEGLRVDRAVKGIVG